MSNMSKINQFKSDINKTEEGIRKELEDLNDKNYCKSLENFGYTYDKTLPISKLLEKDIIQDKSKLSIVNNRIENKIKRNVSGVYIFRETNGLSICSEWEEHSSDKNTPRLNELNKDSSILYVGKDNDLVKRMKSHIVGLSTKRGTACLHWERTSGLKLSGFIDKYPDSPFNFEVDFFYVCNEDSKNYALVNQIVESVLHDNLKPQIGSPRSRFLTMVCQR